MTEKLTYSVAEAAELLGVSHVTLHAEINHGKLRAFTVGNVRRVSRTALDDWVREREEIFTRDAPSC